MDEPKLEALYAFTCYDNEILELPFSLGQAFTKVQDEMLKPEIQELSHEWRTKIITHFLICMNLLDGSLKIEITPSDFEEQDEEAKDYR